ncbi:MAG: 6-hydroxymethylpterin diphosphokinase MptE-like protein [Treponema sp.]|nr:6-hydroxymethylpterin diphosphokinase MptE-like protein [Treponema sp.]
MNIEFLKAKNNEDTAFSNETWLHSSYNPTKEAERYVENIKIPFETDCIIVTEPALSYIVPLIKKKFSCQVGIIRFFQDFSKFDNGDFVIPYYAHKDNFSEYLFNFLGEEKLMSSFFLSFEASAKAFPQENKQVWNNIKNAIEKAKTLLITRQYFEKKWLLNSVKLLSYSKINASIIKKTEKPVVICASGPSLGDVLNVLKKYRDNFFLICLSSAISVLNKMNITPDLYFSTDGGFWAGEHLKHLKKNIPLAFPLEAYCKKSSLTDQTILPLFYSDGISKKLYDLCGLSYYPAERNGTVSGTAIKFAENLTDNDIYFLGLDLCSQKGYQHTQPNEIEFNNQIHDCRIKNLETRVYPGCFPSESLKIYENWFKTQNFKNNIFRVINNKKNNLNNIKDISSNLFEKKIINFQKKEETIFQIKENKNIKKNREMIYEFILKNNDTLNWKKSLFPLDFVSLKHSPSNKDLENKIDNENNKLLKKIWNLLNV